MRPAENHIQVAPAPPQPSFSLPSKLILLTSSIAFAIALTLSACVRETPYRVPQNDLEQLMIFACQHLISQGGYAKKTYQITTEQFHLVIDHDNAWIHIWDETQEKFIPAAFTSRGGLWEVYNEENKPQPLTVCGKTGRVF